MKNLRSADEATSHLTGETTSHSTRLPKDSNRVAGYNPAKDAGQVIGYSLLCLVCLLFPALAWAAGVGSITHLGGVLFATRADGTKKLLSVKSEILVGDTLKTEANTFARIKFTDGSEVVLRPETVFQVNAYSYNTEQKQQDSFLVSLLKGGMRSVTGMLGKRSPEQFKLTTSAATIGIRGTHFGALLCNNDCANIPTVAGQAPANGLHTDTAQGATIVTNAGGSVEVPAGSFSYTPSQATPPKLIPPSQGIQVTMPAAISSNKASGSGLGASDSNTCVVK